MKRVFDTEGIRLATFQGEVMPLLPISSDDFFAVISPSIHEIGLHFEDG